MESNRPKRKTYRRYLTDPDNPIIPKQSRKRWRLENDQNADTSGLKMENIESSVDEIEIETTTTPPNDAYELNNSEDLPSDNRSVLNKRSLTTSNALALESQIENLQKTVSLLREENKSLRHAFTLISGLPDLIKRVEELSSLRVNTAMPAIGRSSPIPVTPTSRGLTSVLTSRGSPNTLNSPSRLFHPAPPAQQPFTSVFDCDVDEDGKVNLGHGIHVNAQNLQHVNKADLTKTTYTMCEVVFTREELANSTMTGRVSNAFKENMAKPQLSPNGVSAIIDFVTRIHPTAEHSTIKTLIGRKLNIAQKLEKRKRMSGGGEFLSL